MMLLSTKGKTENQSKEAITMDTTESEEVTIIVTEIATIIATETTTIIGTIIMTAIIKGHTRYLISTYITIFLRLVYSL